MKIKKKRMKKMVQTRLVQRRDADDEPEQRDAQNRRHDQQHPLHARPRPPEVDHSPRPAEAGGGG